ncbi:DNA-binding response regulator [Peribacillus saganii]|uniref:DNA-binding response regulator n=1 Tax=Peribacillus saganii TaxID=2303992 RepID=A0A372LRG9_9BACI|nr:LytTR family DNA-binding domain-containing protein [Peribacillus saganii]RFU70798.1 DNA-binding response regulator [Peribacillus saganii]
MKVLIAEDDSSTRKFLKHFIERLPNFDIVGEACNGEDLISSIVTSRPDIVLVDIGMPLLNGMDAIKSCVNLFPMLQVIFITGSDDYALEAFNVKAVDYILKPVEGVRLYTALERAAQNHDQALNKKTAPKKDLMIKLNQSIIFIPQEEILFIERLERKSVIHTKVRQYETNDSLGHLGSLLDSRFLACHRSYIINMEKLEMVEASGQSYKAHFKNYEKTAKISKNKLVELQQYKS